jgi:hypothetical protein
MVGAKAGAPQVHAGSKALVERNQNTTLIEIETAISRAGDP